MLSRRLISAFIIISIILLLLRLDYWLGSASMWGRPGIVLSLLAILLGVMAAGEMISLWPAAQRPDQKIVMVSTFAMILIACIPSYFVTISAKTGGTIVPTSGGDRHIAFVYTLIGLLTAFVITFCYEMFRFGSVRSQAGTVTDRLARATLIYVYLSMLFGFLMPHRELQADNALGLLSLIALIATVKLSDSFAYFAGKSLGTVKLAPLLSPKKTIQGAIGALVGGCVAAAIVVFLVAPMIFHIVIDKPWWWFVAYGLVVTIAGMVGDLAESLLKRDADCKDSSSWIPGLGGVLDVLDSLIFAAPVSFLMWRWCG